jgi:Rrf2 family nitric oxide-sensitive transcriptional repressor
MQLKSYTDYSLRILIYLGLHGERMVTIAEVAEKFNISKNHLMKVAQRLSACGYVRSTPGKHGGMRLGRAPQEIRLGDVVRSMEGGFDLVECLREGESNCCIFPACHLKGILNDAMRQFLQSLDRYTLEDLLQNRAELLRLTALKN